MKEDKKQVVIADKDLNGHYIELSKKLESIYMVKYIKDGLSVIHYASKNMPDIILLSSVLSGLNGFEVSVRLKANPVTRSIPIIFISKEYNEDDMIQAFESGAVDYISRIQNHEELIARIKTHLVIKEKKDELSIRNILLEHKVYEETIKLNEVLDASIWAIVQTIESRDPYTAGHQQRVSKLAVEIAKKLNLGKDHIFSLSYAGMLHDLGKIRIPDSVLNRPGKLLAVEYSMLKIHPEVGYDILKKIPAPWPLAKIVLEHHERLDGSGYPNGLMDSNILLESKILSVADVTEAMSSHRPYRPALGIDEALKELKKNRGILYDKGVVDACFELFVKDNYKF